MKKNKAKNKKRKITSKNNKLKNTILLEGIVCILYTIFSLITCTLIFTVDIPIKSVFYVIVISLAFSAFFAGYISGKKMRTNGLIYGVIFNLLPILLFIMISLLLNGFTFDSRLFITLATMLLMSAAGGATAVNSRKKSK